MHTFSFYYHYKEIKWRFFYLIFSFILTFITTSCFSVDVIYIISKPLLNICNNFIFTNLTEAFYSAITLCFFTSSYSILPFFVYQAWCFFLPSCFANERKNLNLIIFFIIFLYIISIFFNYFVILPKVYMFLVNYEIKNKLVSVLLQARIQPYIYLVCKFFMILGIIFQLPFYFFLFFKYKIITPIFICKNRKFLFFFSILLSSIIAPPDIVSQFLLTIIFILFFECIIWFGFFFYKKEKFK